MIPDRSVKNAKLTMSSIYNHPFRMLFMTMNWCKQVVQGMTTMRRAKIKATIKWSLRKERKPISLIDLRGSNPETKTTKTTTKSNLKRDRCVKISEIPRRRLEDLSIRHLHPEEGSLPVNNPNPSPSVNSLSNNISSHSKTITHLRCSEEWWVAWDN